ncbi:hypothetical protein Taro_043150 [Colocasia esculenta]|uniref:Uncharacterized protein n=1 Tax=Colocasia esculenta TaxID=4460 RepID=A0A843X3P2_COLES|nr:hypothetical protein [Colocasia esculenta]
MAVANQTAKARRPYPLSPSSYSKRQHIWTPISQRPHLAANSYSTAAGPILSQDQTCTTLAHTIRPHHTGLTMAITTITHMIHKDPKTHDVTELVDRALHSILISYPKESYVQPPSNNLGFH